MNQLVHLIVLVSIVTSLWTLNSEAVVLNDYILDYQPLHFDPSHLHNEHNRAKRAIDSHLYWSFNAYGRLFNLHLQPLKSIFTDTHELVLGSELPQAVDTSFIYEGSLTDDSSSTAFISIINGSVSGHVVVPGHTTYYIEPARNHFKSSTFHTIIYRESHMNLDPYRHKREAFETCGNRELFSKLDKMWQQVEPVKRTHKSQFHQDSTSHNKYSAKFNSGESWSRQTRDLKSNARTCVMSLQADKLLFNHYLQKYSSPERATEEILSLFASHIYRIKDIYGNTSFARTDDPSVVFRLINFQLQRSKIITDCQKPGFCTDNLDVSNFLDLTSEDDFNDFCLVHTFTYRDFVGGTLGLAWVATPQSPNAGVCGKFNIMRDSNNKVAKRSLNTGIVTLINFKQEVPARVSQLTFAHEVGHNFGAQHDATDSCAPYGTSQPNASKGNYIMFPSATQGNLPNNNQFSSCSKDSIARVLETLEPNGNRVYCFSESDKPFCGNKIVENDEQCDCGFIEDCMDKCCIGRDLNNELGCNLSSSVVPGKQVQCSPSQGPCCKSSDCSYVANGTLCQTVTDCTHNSTCTGLSATCPKPESMPNNTFCADSTKVCMSGECIGSVCESIEWKECFLTLSETTNSMQMCYISCKQNDSSECISSFDEGKVKANPKFSNLLQRIKSNRPNSDTSLGIERPAGSPCNNFKGYCDMFYKCRNVDAEGPFKQLTDMIFSPVTLKIIRTWIEDHWWAVLLMCIGVVIFMGVFIKIFEYNTPSKDPKKNQPPPPSNRPQGVSRSQPNKRAAATHSADVPMQDRGNGRNQGYNSYNQGQGNDVERYAGNQGYDNHAFQGQGPSQQYDRISKTKRY
uniref:ADAM10 endopeptidase n=3 Tax=Arion vulgaris TaxID=1028688 RepID=A0A0B6ZP31_9EUPU